MAPQRTITFTPDHGLIQFKNLFNAHRKIMFLATGVLLLCIFYFFRNKTNENCIIFSDTTCTFKWKQYVTLLLIRTCIDSFLYPNRFFQDGKILTKECVTDARHINESKLYQRTSSQAFNTMKSCEGHHISITYMIVFLLPVIVKTKDWVKYHQSDVLSRIP